MKKDRLIILTLVLVVGVILAVVGARLFVSYYIAKTVKGMVSTKLVSTKLVSDEQLMQFAVEQKKMGEGIAKVVATRKDESIELAKKVEKRFSRLEKKSQEQEKKLHKQMQNQIDLFDKKFSVTADRIEKLTQFQEREFKKMAEKTEKDRTTVVKKQARAFERALTAKIGAMSQEISAKLANMTDKREKEKLEGRLKQLEILTKLQGTEFKKITAQDGKKRDVTLKKELEVLEGKISARLAKLTSEDEKKRKRLESKFDQFAKKSKSELEQKVANVSLSRSKLVAKLENRLGQVETLAKLQEGELKKLAQKSAKTQDVVAKKELETFDKKLSSRIGNLTKEITQKLAKLDDSRKKKELENRLEFVEVLAKTQEIELKKLAKKSVKAQDVVAKQELEQFRKKLSSKIDAITREVSTKLTTLKHASVQEKLESRLESVEKLAKLQKTELKKLAKKSAKTEDVVAKKELEIFDKKLASRIGSLTKEITQKLAKLDDSKEKKLLEGRLKNVEMLAKTQENKLKALAQKKELEAFDKKLVSKIDEVKKELTKKLAKKADDRVKKELEDRLEQVEVLAKTQENELRKVETFAKVQESELKKLAQKSARAQEAFDKKLALKIGDITKEMTKKLAKLTSKDSKRRDKLEHKLHTEIGEAVSNFAKKNKKELEEKIAHVRAGIKKLDHQKQLQAYKKEQDMIVKKELEVFDKKLVSKVDQITKEISKKLIHRVREGEHKELAEVYKQEQDAAISRRITLFNQKLASKVDQITQDVAHSLKMLASDDAYRRKAFENRVYDRVGKKIDTEVANLQKRVLEANDPKKQVKAYKQVQAKAMKEQIKIFDKKLEATFSVVSKKIDDNFTQLALQNKEKTRIETEKIKKELMTLANNMLQTIEVQLEGSRGALKKENQKKFKMFSGRLKEISQSHAMQLKDLNKKLAQEQKNRMAFEKRKDREMQEITQKEVDGLIKQEVNKQLTSFKSKRDPRVSRLKKVVALEKMRRLVKNLVEGDEYEGAFD